MQIILCNLSQSALDCPLEFFLPYFLLWLSQWAKNGEINNVCMSGCTQLSGTRVPDPGQNLNFGIWADRFFSTSLVITRVLYLFYFSIIYGGKNVNNPVNCKEI